MSRRIRGHGPSAPWSPPSPSCASPTAATASATAPSPRPTSPGANASWIAPPALHARHRGPGWGCGTCSPTARPAMTADPVQGLEVLQRSRRIRSAEQLRDPGSPVRDPQLLHPAQQRRALRPPGRLRTSQGHTAALPGRRDCEQDHGGGAAALRRGGRHRDRLGAPWGARAG